MALAILSSIAFAQDDMKPKKGNKGLGVFMPGITSGASANKDVFGYPALMFRYFTSDKMAIRVGFGINTWNNKWETTDSTSGNTAVTIWDSTYKKMAFSISPGIEKHMGKGAKLDPYMGLALSISIKGKSKMTSNTEVKPNTGTGSTSKFDGDMKGGMGVGVNLIAGFNYFFTQHLAVGAELMWGFNTTTDGGEWNGTWTNTAGGTTTTTKMTGNNKTKSSGLSVGATAGINLSWFW